MISNTLGIPAGSLRNALDVRATMTPEEVSCSRPTRSL